MSEAKTVHQEDLRFLNNAYQWPHWPACPVKRYVNGVRQIGIVFNLDGNHAVPKVYKLNVHQGWTPKQFDTAEILGDYATLEGMLLDGWEVD